MGSILPEAKLDLSSPDLIEKLKASIKESKVITPTSDEYTESIKRWADSSIKPAGAVVLAKSAADISSAVTFARTWSLDLAICGGGHATNGASSSDGGLVVDLSQLRAVTVDTSTMTIKAQGGCLWVDVDNAAGEYGLATVGGTVNHTGIGGLTLGGGYGWLSGKYGLVIDNLVAVQMVLADGSIVTASDSENPDLFWAVRGAGQAFGVAVEFTYRAYEQKDPVWGGLLMFPTSKLEAFVAAANQIVATRGEDSGFFVGMANPPPAFQPLLMAALFHNGTKSEGESMFEPLLSLGPMVNTTGSMPYPVMNSILNIAALYGGYKCVKGATYVPPVRPAFFRELLDEFIAFRDQNSEANGMIMLEMWPVEKICTVPHSATAFANRGMYQNAFIGPKFAVPGFEQVGRQWARDMAEKFHQERRRQKEAGEVDLKVEGVGEYGNYDNLNQKGSVIFGSNYDRIKELKRKYDPDNVFNKSHVQM